MQLHTWRTDALVVCLLACSSVCLPSHSHACRLVFCRNASPIFVFVFVLSPPIILSLLMRFTSMCPCIALFPACMFFILIRLFCLSVCLLACLLVVDIRAIHSQELTKRRTIIEIGQRRSSISYHPEQVSIIKHTPKTRLHPFDYIN